MIPVPPEKISTAIIAHMQSIEGASAYNDHERRFIMVCFDTGCDGEEWKGALIISPA